MVQEKGRRLNMTAAILAGGENRRFGGRVKANIIIGGSSILEGILDVVEPLFSEVLIIANDPVAFSAYNRFRIIPDHFRKAGPLGGIHAALSNAGGKDIFIFASDMPSLSSGLILRQADLFSQSDCEVLIPRNGNHDEPLHAIYAGETLERLEKFLSQGERLAIKDFLIFTKVQYFNTLEQGFSEDIFTNINTPEDLRRASKPIVKGRGAGRVK